MDKVCKRQRGVVPKTKIKRSLKMQINLDVVLVNRKGEPLVDGPEPITLRVVLCNALEAVDNNKPSGEEKSKRYKLVKKLWSAPAVIDLSVDDLSMLKNRVADSYPSPLVVGQVWELLDPQFVN